MLLIANLEIFPGDRGVAKLLLKGGMDYVESMAMRNYRYLADCFQFCPGLSSKLESSYFWHNYNNSELLERNTTQGNIIVKSFCFSVSSIDRLHLSSYTNYPCPCPLNLN